MKYMTLTVLLALGFSSAAHACGDDLRITNTWMRPTAAGKDMTAAFFDVTNTGKEAHKLTSVTLPDAVGEIHTTTEENGVFRMRHLLEVEIPAGETVQFKPKSLHVMVMKQKQPLQEGDTTTLTLHCADGESIAVAAPVKTRP